MMSDQEVTYSTLRFPQSPSEARGGLRTAPTKRPRKAAEKEFSVCWHRTAVTLGLICLLLLIIIAVLVTNLFQYIQEKDQQEAINVALRQELQQKQNETSFMTQLGTHQTSENNISKNKIHWPALDPKSYSKNACQLCESPLACCERKCYYFLKGNKTWPECKESCQHRGFSLLKIDDEKELNLLRPRVGFGYYWIGLFFDRSEYKWKWVDNGTSRIDFMIKDLSSRLGSCIFLTKLRLSHGYCDKTYNCICGKTTEGIFPASA